MKVFADLSALVKVAFVCLLVGFVLGVCLAKPSWLPRTAPVRPAPVVPASVAPASVAPASVAPAK